MKAFHPANSECMAALSFVTVLLSKFILRTESFSMPTPPSMVPGSRFFLDTAVVSEWDALIPLGIFHGITTNPTLLERANIPCTIPSLRSLTEIALSYEHCQEFMCQTWGESAEEMFRVGLELAPPDIQQNVVIKVPVTPEGTKAAALLIGAGVRVCLTACYTSHQALIATGVGAEYLAPYVGRMTEAGKDGVAEVITMQRIVDTCCIGSTSTSTDDMNSMKQPMGGFNIPLPAKNTKPRTRILVASIRDVETMVELAARGFLDTFTFSPDIARSLFMDPMTQQAAADFDVAVSRGQARAGQQPPQQQPRGGNGGGGGQGAPQRQGGPQRRGGQVPPPPINNDNARFVRPDAFPYF